MSHWAYYNENDPFAAAWLRELIRAGEIADGIVDDRSIWEVRPEDVQEFTSVHFFAGIGGWSLALKLAGWPEDRRVWTGSCPCQPFSAAGRRKGHGDDRHLWPIWACLIGQCRPDTIFGEQVAGAIGHGWLDAVSTDLEAEGYTVGAIVLGAHSVGAPHIRQRLWFVAHAERGTAERRRYDVGTPARDVEDGAQERERVRVNPSGTDYKGAPTKPYNERGGQTKGQRLDSQVVHLGPTPTGSPAATAKPGQLNPAHSRWLQGYPPAWDGCAATAMPSSRKSRRK